MVESVEKAMQEMLRLRVACAAAGTEAANKGPRMISAPSSTACCVPCPAPWGLPASSLIRSWMFGFWNSASAISAAFFIEVAATPALPDADSGRIRPTLTWPLPATIGCWVGPAGAAAGCCCEENGLENELRLCCTPAQALSSGVPRISPSAARRVAFGVWGPEEEDLRLNGPTIVSLGLTDRRRPGSPPSKPIRRGGFRHIVGEWLTKTKALWLRRASAGSAQPPFCPFCAANEVMQSTTP